MRFPVFLVIAGLLVAQGVAGRRSPRPSPSPSPRPSPSPSPSPSTKIYSTLWGVDGSGASPRLGDFSRAGYREGSATPTALVNKASVMDYGAKGDGVSDDSAAVQAAINGTTCAAGVVCVLFFPPGRYRLSTNFTIAKSLVLRGAGVDATTLFFDKTFEALYGNTANYTRGDQSQWSFGPGMLNFKGSDSISYTQTGTLRARVTANTSRGDTTVRVSDTSRLAVNQWVRITASDWATGPAAGQLPAYFYGTLVSDWSDLVGDANVVQVLARITAIVANTSITLDRPIQYALNTAWSNVTVHTWAPPASSQDQGVVDLTIEHAPTGAYPGHFREKGANALFFNSASNCFARNLRIVNADYSLALNKAYFCSVENVTIDANYNRGAYNGHHGIDVSRGRDNLVTDCTFRAKQVHDFSFEWYTTSTVLRRAKGTDVNIDFHRSAPFANLISDCDLGAGTRPFASGGSSNRGPNAGSWQVFWNLRANRTLLLPAATFGPDLTFVGLYNNSEAVAPATHPYGWVKEDIPNDRLSPACLYEAQLRRRLGLPPPP